jgi:threonine/homoserine/homoserine lactone efflux protein
MDTSAILVLKGAAIGFSIAAPLGPIGFLCMQRTLARGAAHGLATGLGVALADGVYGVVAALGLVAVMDALSGVGPWLRVAGGLFLCWMGWRIMMGGQEGRGGCERSSGLARAFASAFALTLANPMTILSFLAIFTVFELVGGEGESSWGALLVVAGVFCGSLGWWVTLTIATSVLRALVREKLAWVNRAAGAVVLVFGALAVFG